MFRFTKNKSIIPFNEQEVIFDDYACDYNTYHID